MEYLLKDILFYTSVSNNLGLVTEHKKSIGVIDVHIWYKILGDFKSRFLFKCSPKQNKVILIFINSLLHEIKYKKIIASSIVNLSLLREALKLRTGYLENLTFYMKWRTNSIFKSWNLFLQYLLKYLGPFKVITTGRKPKLSFWKN